MSGDWFDGIPGPPRVAPAHPVQGEARAEVVEVFRAALMRAHADDWDMETVSEAAHICANAAAAEVEQLKAERDALLNIARRSNHRNCPLFGHSDGTRRRRIDCADDQCMNSEHVKYVECDHVWHDLNEWLAEHGAEGTE